MKYAFKLRDNSISNNPVLLNINSGSHMGHTDIAIIIAELVQRDCFNESSINLLNNVNSSGLHKDVLSK